MASGPKGIINIRDIGDAGYGGDWTSIINLALQDLLPVNGGIIDYGPGQYGVSSSLAMAGVNNVQFRGSGLGNCNIVRVGGFAGATFSSLAGVVRVRDMGLPDFSVQGSNAAPSIPASTVALTNPFPFDCEVHIIAGTITVISLGGTATNLTSNASGVTVLVKAGQTITMTYSVVPTSWTWFGIGG